MSGCTKTPFGWSCSDIEERYFAWVGAQHEEEQRQAEQDEDMTARLAGGCEVCGESGEHGLTIVAGLALCDGCLAEEHGEDCQCDDCVWPTYHEDARP